MSSVANVQINLSTDVKGSLSPARIDLSADFNFTGALQIGGAAVATQAYADALKAGLAPKDEVDAASTGNLTLSGTQTVDGVALTAGMRCLAKNQTDPIENGVYVVAAGAWARSTDFNADADVTNGALIPVKAGGAVNGSLFFLMLTADPAVGTDAITFTQFPAAGGASAGADGDISTIEAGATADAGVSAAFAPADHVHAVSTAAPSGTITETGSASEGSASSLLRSDAVFALPNLGREGASTLIGNIRRRDAELAITPPTNGAVVDFGSDAQNLTVAQAGTPGMSVVVSAGRCYAGSGGDYARGYVPAGNQSVTIDAADATDPRYDAIVIPSGGSAPACRKGTPAGSPSLPSLTGGDTLIAVVKVGAAVTSITDADIHDHRRFSNPKPRSESFTADGSTSAFTTSVRGKIAAVFRDGLRMIEGADADASHYQISDAIEADGTTITFGADPVNDALIVVDFVG